MDLQALETRKTVPIRSFQETIPVRGCKLSLKDVKEVYSELSAINKRFGEAEVARIERVPGEDALQWVDRKKFLLLNAFCLTITIVGGRDQEVYDESEDIFSMNDLPKPIRLIYFTNLTAWRRHAGDVHPPNQIEVHLDFGKPDLLDPNPLVSDQTPNNSNINVRAQDIAYFRAVQQVVERRFLNRRTWYSPIHRSFAYDVGIWALALPAGLILVTFYMEHWFPVGSELEAYRIAFFIYALGIALICYRFITSYMKWAFPVNILIDNEDAAWKHRLVLGAIFSGLAWTVADVISSFLPFGP